MLYVLTSDAGALLGWAQDPANLRIGPDSQVVQREAWDAPPPLPYVWSVEARDWVVPAPPVQRWTVLEFASRFTELEQVALEMAQESSPDAQTRAALRVVEKNLARATEIRADDARTIRGVEICVDVLVAMGVLAASDAAARIDEILDRAPVAP